MYYTISKYLGIFRPNIIYLYTAVTNVYKCRIRNFSIFLLRVNILQCATRLLRVVTWPQTNNSSICYLMTFDPVQKYQLTDGQLSMSTAVTHRYSITIYIMLWYRVPWNWVYNIIELYYTRGSCARNLTKNGRLQRTCARV